MAQNVCNPCNMFEMWYRDFKVIADTELPSIEECRAQCGINWNTLIIKKCFELHITEVIVAL